MRVNRVIFFLSLLGIAMAVYVLQGFIRQAPIVCVNTGCETVRKSAASYILGIPVPAFGFVGYSLLALLAFLRTTPFGIRHSAFIIRAMLGIGAFGVLFVTWFTYTELFVIKAICTWCAVSAVNMVIIFLLSTTSFRLEKSKIQSSNIKSSPKFK